MLLGTSTVLDTFAFIILWTAVSQADPLSGQISFNLTEPGLVWFSSVYCWPMLRARYASLDDVGPSISFVRSPSSVVCPMVISQKLSKISPYLLWNTVRKLVPLILLPLLCPLLGRYSGFTCLKVCSSIGMTSC